MYNDEVFLFEKKSNKEVIESRIYYFLKKEKKFIMN